jgi:malonate transporter MadM subunit
LLLLPGADDFWKKPGGNSLIMEVLNEILEEGSLLVAVIIVAIMILVSGWISTHFTRKKIPAAAIAIFAGLGLAYAAGRFTNGTRGVADVGLLSGFTILGGSFLRDFTIVATAMGARLSEIKKAGAAGLIALSLGVTVSFVTGVLLALLFGYRDAVSLTTLGAGACTFIVGPVTGSALGATSEVIALSIAAGVIKSIGVTIATPWVARFIGLNNPQSAMVFGGLIGTTSGVAAGLAATDPKLVPYGALTATFYTGLGCLVCPSAFFLIVKAVAG